MDSFNDSIQIDLVSNASLNTYPSNTLSSFTNDLHKPIRLEGEWEVALIEIFHPTSIENDQNKIVHISITRDIGGLVRTKKIPFEYKINEKIEDIISRLNKKLKDMNISYLADPTDSFNVSSKTSPKFKPIKIEKEKIRNRYTISPGSLEGSGMFDEEEIEFLPIFDDPQFLRCLGFDHVKYATEALKFIPITSDYAPTDPSLINLLFVYTDIVREHHVGDSMSNCLRAIPLRAGDDAMISSHVFPNPYYFPIRYGDIKNISILLTDETGTPMKFVRGRTYVTLHFRRRLYKASFN